MTPRNPLDDKVIVDREILEYLLDQINTYAKHFDVDDIEEFPICQRAKQALATDLTGWVAVPFEETAEMYDAICEAAGNEDYEGIWTDALAACPPLPGGRE